MNRLQHNILMYADITIGHGPFFDGDDMTPEEVTAELTEDRWFRGLFSYAGVIVIGELFNDVMALRASRETNIDGTMQLCGLPEAFADQYTPMFAQAFLCTVVNVTQKFTEGWSPAANLAEELAVKLILDEAKALREQADLELDPYVISAGYVRLLEDVDFRWLYEGKSGYLGEKAGQVCSWFTPYNVDRHAAPYARMDLHGG